LIVVDSSALIHMFLYPRPTRELRKRLESGGRLHAPQLLDPEFLHALRGVVRSGQVSADRASIALDDLVELPVQRHGHEALAERVWALRHNLSAYDAVYVSLAEVLDCPIVTSDSRIARAGGHDATVEVYAMS
jgi:predicted nucleic acid-binding protein